MHHTGLFVTFYFSILFFSNTAWSNSQTLPLPIEAFSQLPSVSGVKLSPDGNYLGMLLTHKGETYLTTLHIPTQKTYPILKTENNRIKFNWFTWASNDTLLISARFPASRYGTKTLETRLIKQKANGEGEPKPVFNNKYRVPGRKKTEHIPQFWDDIVSLLPDDPEHILLSLDLKQPNQPDVYKIKLRNGSRKLVTKHRGNVTEWIADQQGRVRVGIAFKKTDYTILVYDLLLKKWRKAWSFESFDSAQVIPLGFGSDPNILYIKAYHQGYKALFTVNTSSNDFNKELVYSDPHYDVDGDLIRSPKTRDVVGIYHAETNNGYKLWGETYKALQRGLDNILPETSNQVVGFSNNERRYIMYSENSNTPGVYFFGDRDQKILQPILETYPQLMGKTLAKREKVTYQARDGLKLEAYLTTPSDYKSQQPRPTIIFPHGGPIAREYAGFDYWAQFFANLGYIVLQPNFRGSSGYGYQFKMQAIAKYGGAMQDDLVDGVNWLVEKGLSNPNKICIAGASYGGFAALVGATKTPDVFRCAISFAGVSDLHEQRNSYRNYTSHHIAQKQYGKDTKALKKISPINHVDKIKIPILLAHGSKDRVVRVRQSRRMAKALKKNNKDFKYLELEDGTHYLDNQKNRMAFFKAMEQFLKKNLN